MKSDRHHKGAAKDMTLFEKKRYIIKLIREWFPDTPIYFDEYLATGNAAETQFNGFSQDALEYFQFSEWWLLGLSVGDVRDIALHEIAHGLVSMGEIDGHGDRWLKVFYSIGGVIPWGRCWVGWYRSND